MVLKFLYNDKIINNIDEESIISFEDESTLPSIGEHVILPVDGTKILFLINNITIDYSCPKSERNVYIYVNKILDIKD